MACGGVKGGGTRRGMPKIFISYRREDSQGSADFLYSLLQEHFGAENIFYDIDSIPYGCDFVEYIDEQVSQCDVLLALIGQRWIAAKSQEGTSRLHDECDFVRIEIASALARNIIVIPVLVEGAEMPSREKLPPALEELARRQAAHVRPGSDFRRHVERLIQHLEPIDPNEGNQNKLLPSTDSLVSIEKGQKEEHDYIIISKGRSWPKRTSTFFQKLKNREYVAMLSKNQKFQALLDDVWTNCLHGEVPCPELMEAIGFLLQMIKQPEFV